mgnify:CR=1 FL=1
MVAKRALDVVGAALGLLVARVLAQAEPVRAAVAHALEAVRRALEREDESRAVDVAFVAGLLEYPAVWRDPARALEIRRGPARPRSLLATPPILGPYELLPPAVTAPFTKSRMVCCNRRIAM